MVLGEFVRPPVGKAADKGTSATNSKTGTATRTTWADISEEDGETLVGKDVVDCTGESGVTVVPPNAPPAAAAAEDEDLDAVDDPQAKLTELRAAIKALQLQGIRAGNAIFDHAQREADNLVKDMAEAKAKRGEPRPIELVRAQAQLDKAVAARSRLDGELDDLYERFKDEVAKKTAAIDAAESRIERSADKVAKLKEALSGKAPPREAEDKIRSCSERFQGIGPALGELLDLFLAEPALQAHAEKVQHIRQALNGVADDACDAARILTARDAAAGPASAGQTSRTADGNTSATAAPAATAQATAQPAGAPEPLPPAASGQAVAAEEPKGEQNGDPPGDQQAATSTRASRKGAAITGTAASLLAEAKSKGKKNGLKHHDTGTGAKKHAGGATAPVPVPMPCDRGTGADDDPMVDAENTAEVDGL